MEVPLFFESHEVAAPLALRNVRRMLRPALLVALALAALVATASERVVRKSVEADMRVIGTAVIGPDGGLQSYILQPGLPAEVKALADRYLSNRTFDVVTASGQPETIRAVMSLQVVARQSDRGGAEISVRDSIFQEPGEPRYIKGKLLTPPQYPSEAHASGFTGVVYLALRLNSDGTVAETHVEQVNMTGVASERELRRGRGLLANATAGQARNWTFDVAPEELAKQVPISIRIAVEFQDAPVKSQAEQSETTWQQYVPGPYSPIPWSGHGTSSGLGAMVPGWIFPLESKIKLRER
jgi:hypothetical protein